VSGGVVFRRALAIVSRTDLPEVATSDVVAVMEDSRPGPLQFAYEAARQAGCDREVVLDRGAAIFFNHCAGQIADDLADGDCDYLDDPHKTGPAAQYILQNLFYETLVACGTGPDVIAAIARDLAEAAGAQHVEVRTRCWTAPLALSVGEGLVGRQYSAYMRLLWADTPLEHRAPKVGCLLGLALHVVADLRSGDPRITTLSASDRALVLQRARASADALDSLGLPWLDTILTDVTAVLNGADG
jgi:hypothetical protein